MRLQDEKKLLSRECRLTGRCPIGNVLMRAPDALEKTAVLDDVGQQGVVIKHEDRAGVFA
jgi:hypothetical protein